MAARRRVSVATESEAQKPGWGQSGGGSTAGGQTHKAPPGQPAPPPACPRCQHRPVAGARPTPRHTARSPASLILCATMLGVALALYIAGLMEICASRNAEAC
jgi:hypothetical protein